MPASAHFYSGSTPRLRVTSLVFGVACPDAIDVSYVSLFFVKPALSLQLFAFATAPASLMLLLNISELVAAAAFS